MATTYPIGVYRKTATGLKPNPGTESKGILLMPGEFSYVTLWAVGSAGATCKVEGTYSDGEAISGGSAVWVAVDASLNSVGTTPVAYDVGTRVFTAFRVSSLVDNQTATLVLLGK
jgi:hypothetical protein